MKKISFNREIYSDETIKQTMSIYQNHAKTTIKFKKMKATITFWKCRHDESQTIKEFENYMIGLENS